MPTAMHPVRAAFQRAVSEAPLARMWSEASVLFVGYSGGADSAALLFLTAEYCRQHSVPCEAIHVHHGIRGAEADGDAEVCRTFCERLGIVLHVRYADVPAYAALHHLGIEEAARQMRYGIFEEILRERPNSLCATAHSADDQLETVLFHMLRGSGIDGLCGIPAVRDRYVRPLLSASAADIRDFCRTENLPFVQDSTNADTAYTRNYIRAEIVPRLRQIHPDPEAAIVRMCSLLREDAAYLDTAAKEALRDYADASLVPENYLKHLPDAVLSRAIIRLYENETGEAENLTSVHIAAVMALVRRGGRGKISLPGGRFARLEYGNLDFRPEQTYTEAPPEGFRTALHKGENLFPEFGFGIRMEEYDADPTKGEVPESINIYKLFIWNSFPYDTIQGKVCLRFLCPGDKIRQGGMSRQVRKLFNQRNIPPESRIRCPIVCDDEGILWIPHLGCRDRAEAGDGKVWLFSYFTL